MPSADVCDRMIAGVSMDVVSRAPLTATACLGIAFESTLNRNDHRASGHHALRSGNGQLAFSNGSQFASLALINGALRILVINPESHVKKVMPAAVNGFALSIRQSVCSWRGTSRELLCLLADLESVETYRPKGVVVVDSEEPGHYWPMAEGALNSPGDDRLFEQLVASRIALVDPASQACRYVSGEEPYRSIESSPDGRFVLAELFTRPFLRGSPLELFPTHYVVVDIDSGDRLLHLSAEMRNPSWLPGRKVTLAWCQAGADSNESETLVLRDVRGRVDTQRIAVPKRVVLYCWTTADRAIVWCGAGSAPSLILNPSSGTFDVLETPANYVAVSPAWIAGVSRHRSEALEKNGRLYFFHTLRSGSIELCSVSPALSDWRTESEIKSHGDVVFLLDRMANRVLVRCDGDNEVTYNIVVIGSAEQPNSVRLPGTGDARGEVQLRPVEYATRPFGVLRATMIRRRSATNKAMPCLLWIYPQKRRPTQTVSQLPRGLAHEQGGLLPRRIASLRDISVVADPELFVLREEEDTIPDCWVDRLSECVEALIESLATHASIDKERVMIGGHSFGGYAALLIAAKLNRFAGVISCSAVYNRTQTPFGYQYKSELSGNSLPILGGISGCSGSEGGDSGVTTLRRARASASDRPSCCIRNVLCSQGARLSSPMCGFAWQEHNYATDTGLSAFDREVGGWCDRYLLTDALGERDKIEVKELGPANP